MNILKERKARMEQEKNMSQSWAQFTYGGLADDVSKTRILKAFTVKRADGFEESLDIQRLHNVITWAAKGHESVIATDLIIEEIVKNIFDGITDRELADALLLATVAYIERDPAYGYVAARLLFKKLYKEVTSTSAMRSDVDAIYQDAFISHIRFGVEKEIFDKRLIEFDLAELAKALQPERDYLLDYMGLRTLYERYFVKYGEKRLELPQAFWMRVAMGLALEEQNKTARAIEFYNVMSTLHYVPSTPTLLHASLIRPQLSSCYLTTVTDDLHHIFKCIGDNSQMSKWSGGVANDWTPVRATGAAIKSIKVESQGVIPFLKIANDTTAAINRSGKRRSAAVVYLETWHYDIEDFVDLRKNTGDERRRTHDINTANWIPDLFMKRVIADEKWTLFSPNETPDLHELYGKAFEKRYEEYEAMAERGEICLFKVIPAKQLWRKMLSRLFETGHPWITFKDACNVRSPQDHVGVVHSSNLCTEITLNTSKEETAVCNLGSVNLAQHITGGTLDVAKLATTVETAIRMLDNVIDINFYPTIEGKTSNIRHRPIGLGIMGFQDALYLLDINFDAPQAKEFASDSMEQTAYYAILASSKLAKERGAYKTYHGSKWDRGIFPQDTIDLLEQERGMKIEVERGGKLDWAPVREHVKQFGMRNSNTMAIAPTATISTISGSVPCIEPIYKNIYVKANMTGEFTVVNKYLIEDLKELNLWDQEMLDEIKYYDGNVQLIDRIPRIIKDKYKEAFEIDPMWLIDITALRGKWVDQSQSHNVFMKGVSGKQLNDIFMASWQSGLKTTYYLRTLGASQIEKSTLDAKKFGFTQKRNTTASIADNVVDNATEPKTCSISADPECDVCQ